MKDRIPYSGQEGRIKLTFEDDGSERYATAEMADNPIEEGTELNKANLLSDDTSLLMGIDPSEDPTPDTALQALHNEANAAVGAARAIILDGNINDEVNRSALGEYTQYKDTYGVGYALFMHALRNSTISANFAAIARNHLKLCKDRRQVAQSANAVQVISSLPAAKDIWRRYAFGIKGKTSEQETDYGQYTRIMRNPVNGYLYGWVNTSSYDYKPYVSQDDGKTWENIKTGTSIVGSSRYYKMAFSSDYKYTYLISTGYSNDKDGVYWSTDGINFSETDFRLEAWKVADSFVYDNIFMFKAAEGRYYYGVRGDNEASMGRAHIYVSDGKSTGSRVGDANDDWLGGYASHTAALPIDNGAVFCSIHHPNSQYQGGTQMAYVTIVRYVDGEDKKTSSVTELDELDTEYGSGNNGHDVQMDEDGDIYIRSYVSTRSNGSKEEYRKITRSGRVDTISNAQGFPAGQAGNLGLVYKLPSAQVYIPYISSYTGKLVKDNWGAVTDGAKVMPTFGTDQRGHTTTGKVITIYSKDEHKKLVMSCIDAEAD